MIVMGMEHQQPGDAPLVNTEFPELPEKQRHQISRSGIDQQGLRSPFKEVDTGLFPAQAPESFRNFTRGSDSHVTFLPWSVKVVMPMFPKNR